MLSVKNLVKVYKTKGGTETRALDGISIDFPEHGMVFLLGKSGSGKSTLLNVSGGLDAPTSGEVIVKGKSSKDFTPSDFDSYRNTFVGFIFQEYNILEEFNVEDNIALALQLQGKRNDQSEVDKLLTLVGLEGFGKRKPNTLSGGQKQRVAIARALIKDPRIIMADEPTGALDSETGRQMFETLKTLSNDRLVIVVSHDREFAERYGDRIIELKDGKVVSDISKEYERKEDGNNVTLSGGNIRIKDCSKLSDVDVLAIVAAIKNKKSGEMIISSDGDLEAVKKACNIESDAFCERFEPTDTDKVEKTEYDGSKTNFIKSKLPASHAIKMGASGLKTKPVRLSFTVLLSVIAFTLFGVLLTMMLYDPIYSVATALQAEEYRTTRLAKTYASTETWWHEDAYGNRTYYGGSYQNYRKTKFGVGELQSLNSSEYGLDFAGVYKLRGSFEGNVVRKNLRAPYYAACENYFNGFTDCGEEFLTRNGFTLLAGGYPEKYDEIAISKYVFDVFQKAGYTTEGDDRLEDKNELYAATPQVLIGKTLGPLFFTSEGWTSMTITGVYDVGDLSRYDSLKDDRVDTEENASLITALNDEVNQGFHTLGFVSSDFYEKYADTLNKREGDYLSHLSIEGVSFDYSSIETRLFTTPTRINNNNVVVDVYDKFFNKETLPITLNEDETYVSLWRYSGILDQLARVEIASRDYYVNTNGEVVQKWDNNGVTTKKDFYINYDGDVSFFPKEGYTLFDDLYLDMKNPNGTGSRRFKGYFLDLDGNPVNGDDFEYSYEYAELYMDANGNFYQEKPADIETKQVDGCYVGEVTGTEYYGYAAGSKFLEPTYLRYGFFVDPNTGKISTKKENDDMVFTRNYLKNRKTGEIIIANKYNCSFFDSDGNPTIPPNNGLVQLVYKTKTEDDYIRFIGQNAKFRKAYLNFKYTTGTLYNYEFTEYEDEVNKASFLSPEDFAFLVENVKEHNEDYDLGVEDNYFEYVRVENENGDVGKLKIKGIFAERRDIYYSRGFSYVLSPEFVKNFGTNKNDGGLYSGEDCTTDYVEPEDARYDYVVSKSTSSIEEVRYLLEKRGSVAYEIKGETYSRVSSVSYTLNTFKLIFLIAGGVLALLSSLMLFNFISASISAKSKDIGILRAVGGRGIDVFKIFFSESFIIALICFVLSAVGAGVASHFINEFFVGSALNLTIMNYGVLQVVLIFVISIFVSFAATFIPVYFAAKRPPVASIRSL